MSISHLMRLVIFTPFHVGSPFFHLLVPPIIISPPINQTILYKDNATFSCSATGTPTPNITWWRREKVEGDLPTPVIGERITVELSGAEEITSLLKVVESEVKDAGEYVCIVENPAGILAATAKLTVDGKYDVCTSLVSRPPQSLMSRLPALMFKT